MTTDKRVQERFARYVEQHVIHGRRLDPVELCADAPELIQALEACIATYEQLDRSLARDEADAAETVLPQFHGFRTIERLGGGGNGDVYKLQDVRLGRLVAAKVIRGDSTRGPTLADFLREARSLALFEDPRVVRIHEFRTDSDPPFLLMEYVEGFQLDRIGESLEPSQLARVMADIADAIDRAHRLGIQHRDLKPSNIMLDAKLSPKILDFGLSRGEPDLGHGVGTPAYMAPEQLRPGRPIDARTDVYALGVILYELLCGQRPYAAETTAALVASIEAARPRLPAEVRPRVPEPLQAIALKAMEAEPAARYASARELALDLERYLDGKPVLARPGLYRQSLQQRARTHVEQIRDWLQIRLIYPHEAQRLSAAYASLEARDDDWIVEGRVLSFSQITLYLGAFLLTCGGLLYFTAYTLEATTGWIVPLLVLGVPFAGLSVAARHLFRRDLKAVAVAFQLAAVILLPLFLLIVSKELGWFVAIPDAPWEFFAGNPSNRQMQLAGLLSGALALRLAFVTRTVALSSCFTALAIVFSLTLAFDLGLRTWIEDGRWDLAALSQVPLLAALALLGRFSEARGRAWLARPAYLTAAGLFVAILELLAQGGRAFEYLGLSMARFQQPGVSDPRLLDTLAAMTLNGLLIYAVARVLDRRESPLLRSAAASLFAISPFAILHPLGYVSHVDEYARGFDWAYLALALSIALVSHYRQRKSFYFAGLLNTGAALWYITTHYDWFERPAWAMTVLAVGVALLAAGLGLHARERTRPRG